MLTGKPPFKGPNEYQTFQRIIKLEYQFPDAFPETAKSLVKGLLVLDPSQRLGCPAIKAHPFFAGIDWANLHRSAASPHIPFINRGSEEDLHDESNRISLAAMAISTTEDGRLRVETPALPPPYGD